MSQDDIFGHSNGAYLLSVHPQLNHEPTRIAVAGVLALASVVPDETIAAMIVGSSWRERLLGLCFAMSQESSKFVQPMLASLRDPRGLAIVPVCAALAVLIEKGVFKMESSFSAAFSQDAFDGEVGWALEKARHAAGLLQSNPLGDGPNQGQIFEQHLNFYRSILRR